ncbi:MAG: helix-turn-helix domain-containing protein [Anaerolineales bacterium]|nr:helix-turn-helix domain-containing protein [Anaerolineales bacterium]
MNLLSNAAKFTTAGHITLSAAVETPDLHIWVEDTGSGIPAALQVRLFEAFESTATEVGHGRRGVGLGLAVAQHLVRLHGGSLNLESRAGHGTVCHIRLPLSGASPETPAPLASAPGPDELDRVLQASLVHASDLTRNIAAYIMENYIENITREQIAESMRISTTYVSRVFHKETGMTPWQFLARYRIVQAQKLLLTSTHNVTEIAALVGFNDTPYFVRVFHKETGKSPQQYRKHAR